MPQTIILPAARFVPTLTHKNNNNDFDDDDDGSIESLSGARQKSCRRSQHTFIFLPSLYIVLPL